ncbi:hypothetical protein F4859DRAFT_495396 [Xylaria cf. heliscus]|nr:hypothetical protein F4859DRAFT_495396 [Xylaria cf. heliscus]
MLYRIYYLQGQTTSRGKAQTRQQQQPTVAGFKNDRIRRGGHYTVPRIKVLNQGKLGNLKRQTVPRLTTKQNVRPTFCVWCLALPACRPKGSGTITTPPASRRLESSSAGFGRAVCVSTYHTILGGGGRGRVGYCSVSRIQGQGRNLQLSQGGWWLAQSPDCFFALGKVHTPPSLVWLGFGRAGWLAGLLCLLLIPPHSESTCLPYLHTRIGVRK